MLYSSRDQQRPAFVICLVWIIYGIALAEEFLVVVGYWMFAHGGDDMSFWNLYRHLFIGFILLFDGNVIGRIPLRLKHMLWLYIHPALYALWTIIYADPNMGDDDWTIYSPLDWKKHQEASIIVGYLLIIVAPVIIIFCWLCSLWSKGCTFDGGRRLYRRVRVPGGTDSFDEEEEVLFNDNNPE